MLIVPTTFKSVSIRSLMKMNLHSDCHAVLSINVSMLIKIVIEISRAPTKAKSRVPAYSQALVQTKSLGSGSEV